MATAAPPDDLNYYRLCRLVIDTGGHVLRTLLEQELLTKFPHCDTHNPQDRVDLCVVLGDGRVKHTLMPFLRHFKQLLYQGSQPSTTVKIADLDITLVVILLRNICSFNKRSQAWNNPQQGDTSIEAEVGRLKCARNKLAHSSNTKIPDNEFKVTFQEISATLLKISCTLTQAELDAIRDSGMSVAEIQRWKDWHVAELKTLGSRVQAVESDVAGLKKRMKFDEEPSSNIPCSNASFVGREENIESIQNAILTDQCKIITITGGPGFGKTELSVVIGNNLKDDMKRLVYFVDLREVSDMQEVLGRINTAISHGQTSQDEAIDTHQLICKLNCLGRSRPILLILDNVEDALTPKVNSQFTSSVHKLQLCQNIQLLCTTQEKMKNTQISVTDIELDTLSLHTASQLVQNLCKERVTPKQAEALSNLCGCVPLALHLLSFLVEDGHSVDDLLVELDHSQRGSLQKYEVENIPPHQQLMQCITFSYERLSPDLQKSFRYLHIFPTSFGKEDAAAVLVDATSFNVVKTLNQLKNRSLICGSANTYAMHPLLQSYCKEQMTKDEEREVKRLYCEYYHTTILRLVEMKEGHCPYIDILKVFDLYCDNILKTTELVLGDKLLLNKYWKNLEAFASGVLFDLARFNYSHRIMTSVIPLRLRMGEDQGASAVKTFHTMSLILRNQCKYNEALEYSQKALAIQLKNGKDNHPDTANIYHQMSVILSNQGKYGEALEYSKKALAIKLKKGKENHSDIASTYHQMSVILKNQGKYNEALEYSQKALAIELKNGKDNHPNTASIYHQMSMILSNQGKYNEALEYSKKALAIQLKKGNDNHPDTASIYHQMSVILRDQAKYDEALEYSQKALAIQLKNGKDNHPDTAVMYHQISLILRNQCKYNEALEYSQKALAIKLKNGKDNHPDTAVTYLQISSILSDQEKYNEAMEYSQNALAIQLKNGMDGHPNTGFIHTQITFILFKQGKASEALEYCNLSSNINDSA